MSPHTLQEITGKKQKLKDYMMICSQTCNHNGMALQENVLFIIHYISLYPLLFYIKNKQIHPHTWNVSEVTKHRNQLKI